MLQSWSLDYNNYNLKCKRKCLTLKEIADLTGLCKKENLSVQQAAKKFDIGRTQMTLILKNNFQILFDYEKKGDELKKRKIPKKKEI